MDRLQVPRKHFAQDPEEFLSHQPHDLALVAPDLRQLLLHPEPFRLVVGARQLEVPDQPFEGARQFPVLIAYFSEEHLHEGELSQEIDLHLASALAR